MSGGGCGCGGCSGCGGCGGLGSGTRLPCECCAGVRTSTPRSVVNRPGLPGLAYRVGTYASFMDSMQARLSAVLPELRVRDRDDPALAWLDAAAVLSDVLTFYTERIANEGFLGTATERLSVQELARLVGYRPRPGVAAGVYLAFTLDAGYAGSVPAGTRAQSLPAPGEVVQVYETLQPIQADAAWNVLRPRLDRPQLLGVILGGPGDPTAPTSGHPRTIVLRGAQTGLRPNDPLLADLGDGDWIPLRVQSTVPDPAAGRTDVVVEPWRVQRPAAGPEPLDTAADPYAPLRRALGGVLDLDAHGVGAGRTVQRVLAALSPLAARLDAPEPSADVPRDVAAALPVLRDASDHARRMGWGRLVGWLDASVTALTTALRDSAAVSGLPGRPHQPPPQRDAAFAGLAQLAEALAKPPSRPPANASQLVRGASGTFAASSDSLPRLVAATRPELGTVVYQAWDDRPLTPPNGERLSALRVRARLYGHNAPPRRTEQLRIGVGDREDGERLVIDVRLAEHRLTIDVPWVEGSTDTPFPAADEVVTVELTGASSDVQPLGIGITLSRRQVEVDITARDRIRVEVRGCDPDSVTFGRADDDGHWLTVTGTIAGDPRVVERPDVLSLDASYPQILPGSLVAIERSATARVRDRSLLVRSVRAVRDVSRADYGVSATSTQLLLDRDWFDPREDTFAVVRGTTVYAHSEPLALAPAPIDPVEDAICGDTVELDGLYAGLEAGRWLVVAGERTDVPGVTGVAASELAMVAGVEQVVRTDLPEESTHTVLRLAGDLAYCYRRDTATVYGNVAAASHGETRRQTLGSGDAATAGQRFELRQHPLTHTAAVTPTGVESSLQVRVDEVRWHEVPSLVQSGPTEHVYTTETDDEEQTTVVFGDGQRGARLPTGVENVAAVYRTGIGRAGNLDPGRISQLATRPLGVREVTNPVAATGGADRDDRDAIRRNAPLAVTALDRLVSVRDHEDFARTFAGIGKASATRLTDGRRQLVHVTVAGVDDIPITPASDLFAALEQALGRFGDPHLPVRLAVRRRLVTILSAQVAVLADHRWETVEPAVRTALLDTFGFDRRELAQDLFLSEVLSTVQAVTGVAYVDVDVLAGVDEQAVLAALGDGDGLADLLTLAPRVSCRTAWVDTTQTGPRARLRPAELAYLDPQVPETILLAERLP